MIVRFAQKNCTITQTGDISYASPVQTKTLCACCVLLLYFLLPAFTGRVTIAGQPVRCELFYIQPVK
ncbi:MAG: hypothetical protein JW837_13155, partial [Sedimentisphaerales bacterium]|nr:hypothetical protein [Sedimentisphaerales bacterium]